MTTATQETAAQYREVQVRAVDTETREVSGLAVPYGEVIETGGYRERFERGDHRFREDATLYAIHEHRNGQLPIGRVTAWEDTPEGVLVRARISETARGDEVYTLLRDGVIGGFSVGFIPGEDRLEDGVVVRTSSEFFEVSVTPHQAYRTARVTEVRDRTNPEKGTNMPETDTQEITELRDSVADLERRLEVMAEERDKGAGNRRTVFRSGGDLLRALARNEEAARAEFRDFDYEVRAADGTGPATSAQALVGVTPGGWINRPLRHMIERRRIVNIFDRAPLPSTGNTVDFPQVGTTSGTVEKQATEGAALAYMEVELTTGNATVGTYGGYSSLSRQSIERSDVSYLDAVLRFQAIQYAKATNADARATFAGMTGIPLTLTGGHAGAAPTDWIDLIVDASAGIEDDSLGLLADFIVVSRDVFKSIAHLTDLQERPIFALPNGGQAVNVAGSAAPVTAQFNIAGLPGFVDPGLPVNTCKVASADAMTTLESPGAPFRLEDESVVNLTKDFSLYGYAAFTENDANGVVTVDVDGI